MDKGGNRDKREHSSSVRPRREREHEFERDGRGEVRRSYERPSNATSAPRRSGGADATRVKRENEERQPNNGRAVAPTPLLRIPENKQPGSFVLEIPKKKFTGRCRLFVGNLPNEIQEEELKKMFGEFGEINECFLSGKGFAFLRLDTRAHAESAKEALDNKTVHGRQLRVRFAVHGAAIRVKELSPIVSNEMLYHTFSVFGEVERAVHVVDERGKPTGEGIIEFERKAVALEALKNIEERVFMMTAHSKPLRAELLDPKDEEDGLAERMIQRTSQTLKERELAPRFAENKTFEYMYGLRWKDQYAYEKDRRAQLEQEFREKRRLLDADMEIAYEDFRAQMLREDLERQKRELERLEASRRERVRQMGRPVEEPWNARFLDQQQQQPPADAFMDGPHGRPPTYGREPANVSYSTYPGERDAGNRRSLNDGLDVTKLLQTFRGDIDPHVAGVQRSLNQSLGFVADQSIPQHMHDPNMQPFNTGPPPGLMPQNFFGIPGLASLNLPPPVAVPHHNDYRPSEKRSRR